MHTPNSQLLLHTFIGCQRSLNYLTATECIAAAATIVNLSSIVLQMTSIVTFRFYYSGLPLRQFHEHAPSTHHYEIFSQEHTSTQRRHQNNSHHYRNLSHKPLHHHLHVLQETKEFVLKTFRSIVDWRRFVSRSRVQIYLILWNHMHRAFSVYCLFHHLPQVHELVTTLRIMYLV